VIGAVMLLTSDEQVIVEIYRALGLDQAEMIDAMHRLARERRARGFRPGGPAPRTPGGPGTVPRDPRDDSPGTGPFPPA
jgi:hypothetical protein